MQAAAISRAVNAPAARPAPSSANRGVPKRRVRTIIARGVPSVSTSPGSAPIETGAVLSPTLVDNPAEYADRKVKLVAIVPGNGAKSFLPFPPGLPQYGAGPDWMEVMRHMAMRLTWVDPGFSMDVFAHDAPMEDIKASARDADVFVCVDIQDKVLASDLASALSGVATGAALGCCDVLEAETRVVYQPVTQLRRMEAKLVPWGQANKDLRLMEQVTGLFDRKNHLDLLFLHLLLVDASGVRVPAVDINQDLNLGNVWCIASNCNKQLLECYKNDRCKLSLDCIDACGLNDQVCTYTCIRSYQNDQFQLLARCMLHKHNCLGNDAVRPELPEVLPMTHFRGEPLTHDVAEAIMQGHYGEGEGKKPYSWLAVVPLHDLSLIHI